MLNEFLQLAITKKASDLHLIPGLPPVLRINGQLKRSSTEPLSADLIDDLVYNLLSYDQRDRFDHEQDLDISYSIEKYRFRINIHRERGHIALACRVIPNVIPTMERVDLPPVVYDLSRRTHGLILVTGPAGSGKSTTVAAMLDLINKERAAHIITLEDPIEFIFPSNKSVVEQRELGADMPSFATGLKHVLRQDPDVVMVGEMRDLETVSTTLTLAETGHLVLATLHTFNAAQTIDRIIDMFPPHQQNQVRMQLSISLRGIIAQQLIPHINKGLIATREILLNNPAIANLIRENKVSQIKTVIQTGLKDGMQTFTQDIKRLRKEKHISKEDAAMYINNNGFWQ